MAVQVSACVDVGEADGLAAQDRGTSVAQGIAAPPDTPVAVAVLDCGHPRHRLLSAACVNSKRVATEARVVVRRDTTWAVNERGSQRGLVATSVLHPKVQQAAKVRPLAFQRWLMRDNQTYCVLNESELTGAIADVVRVQSHVMLYI